MRIPSLFVASVALPLVAAASAGCNLLDQGLTIDYALPAQQFSQDFGSQGGTLPDVPCTTAAMCAALPKVQGATATCDAGKCVLVADVRGAQTVDISQSVPSQVANAKAITSVQITAVKFWAPTNSLSFDTPPTDIYVGPSSIKTESDAGAVKMGTIPTIPKGTVIAMSAPQAMSLTDAGRSTLAVLAQNYKTPFNVLAVGKVTIRGGQPVPSGRIDLAVQVSVGYKISLK